MQYHGLGNITRNLVCYRPTYDTSFQFLVDMHELEDRHSGPWHVKLRLNHSTGFAYEPIGCAIIPWQELQACLKPGLHDVQQGPRHQAQVSWLSPISVSALPLPAHLP